MNNFNAEAEAFATLRDMTANFLYELTAIPSISNDELAACDYCYEQFKKIPRIKITKQFMDDSIMDNPRWCYGPYPVSGMKGIIISMLSGKVPENRNPCISMPI